MTTRSNDEKYAPLIHFEVAFGLSQQQKQRFCPLTPGHHKAIVCLSNGGGAVEVLEAYLELQLL